MSNNEGSVNRRAGNERYNMRVDDAPNYDETKRRWKSSGSDVTVGPDESVSNLTIDDKQALAYLTNVIAVQHRLPPSGMYNKDANIHLNNLVDTIDDRLALFGTHLKHCDVTEFKNGVCCIVTGLHQDAVLQLTAMDKHIKGLCSVVGTVENERDAFKKERDTFKKERDTFKKERDSLKMEIKDKLEEHARALKAQHAQHQSQVQALRSQRSELLWQLGNGDSARAELDSQLNAAQAKERQLLDDMHQLTDKYNHVLSQLTMYAADADWLHVGCSDAPSFMALDYDAM